MANNSSNKLGVNICLKEQEVLIIVTDTIFKIFLQNSVK